MLYSSNPGRMLYISMDRAKSGQQQRKIADIDCAVTVHIAGARLFGITGVTRPYGTTAANKIVSISGPDAIGANFSKLVTGSAGSVFGGIVLVPDPGSALLMLLAGLAVVWRRW